MCVEFDVCAFLCVCAYSKCGSVNVYICMKTCHADEIIYVSVRHRAQVDCMKHNKKESKHMLT